MSLGLPYDSDAGREYAGAVTALMCGEAYPQSARLAGGARARSRATRRTASRMLGVIEKHRAHAHKLDSALVPLDLLARGARRLGRGARRSARERRRAATRR